MTSRAPEKKCPACDQLMKRKPVSYAPVPKDPHHDLIASQAREIEELRALVKDFLQSECHFPESDCDYPLHARAEAALAKPHAGKGPEPGAPPGGEDGAP
jgi:hypothetical protein